MTKELFLYDVMKQYDYLVHPVIDESYVDHDDQNQFCFVFGRRPFVCKTRFKEKVFKFHSKGKFQKQEDLYYSGRIRYVYDEYKKEIADINRTTVLDNLMFIMPQCIKGGINEICLNNIKKENTSYRLLLYRTNGVRFGYIFTELTPKLIEDVHNLYLLEQF